MPIPAACPKCQKRYNLPDHLKGRAVSCPACGAQFQVPAARQAVDPQALEARKKAQAEAAKRQQQLKQMGITEDIRKTPDVFDGLPSMHGSADPLGNHFIEDPGFAQVQETSAVVVDDEQHDPMAAMFENPAVAPAPKKKQLSQKTPSRKKKQRKQRKSPWYQQLWFLLLMVFIAFNGIAIGLILGDVVTEDLARQIGWASLYFHLGTAFLLVMWGNYQISRTDSVAESWKCTFTPYLIYYVCTRWETMKNYAYATFAMWGTLPLTGATVYVAGLLENAEV